MAGGAMVRTDGGRGKGYPARMTLYVFLTCVVASSGGLIFGYDVGVSGGVTSMDSFLLTFFPSVYKKEKQDRSTGIYCKFDSQLLTAFTSSLYVAALLTSFVASLVTDFFGRKWSMFRGGMAFILGAGINATADNLFMLILGRFLLGVGVGYAIQSVPIYLSEIAPPRLRGMLNIMFQLMVTIGILIANIINYFTNKIEGAWGWRVSLAFACVPAAIIAVGSLVLPETPNSLIERGHTEEAEATLRLIRGVDDISLEFSDLVAANKRCKEIRDPWSVIMERKYRPQLAMAILIPFFQQLTGINIIMFYAPLIYKAVGFSGQTSLVSTVIIGTVNVVATLISIITVDKVGRRGLLLHGGVQMLISQLIVGTLITLKFGSTGEATDISRAYASCVLFFICVYIAAFAWSWGPLGWLIPSEILSLEIRSVGQCIAVSVNMFFTFLIAQIFLTALCHMKYGLFFFFAGWVVVMTVFVALFLPETKNIPIEEMSLLWKEHWFWSRFIKDEENTETGNLGRPRGCYSRVQVAAKVFSRNRV
ncbi:sugar transport protein MST3-like [Musa acuminata AAA Group]|uniref:(wild Malaysian banana) hypothetical protein n=1 Tax=Musa acuminata subsp. malaccensis TaxID=214687 RepID=A0A804KSM1_MUSAM|nr:PREDICTED: sugar carrier protein C-like [Musa acuminata subsp. malaccensis]CAG1852664.1 unnamed protein product [Musa acuminata subsp. malaccensis]